MSPVKCQLWIYEIMNYVKVTAHSFLGGDGGGVEMYNSYLNQIVVSMNI